MNNQSLIILFFVLFLLNLPLGRAQDTIPRQQPIENLKCFARLSGYTQYFYPGDEAANLDWDAFLVYGSKEILSAPNPTFCKKKLEILFKPIAPGVKIFPTEDSLKLSMEELVPGGIKPNYVPIAWQHLGVDLGEEGPYQSIRTNRSSSKIARFSKGKMLRSMDIKKYQGKFIRVEGYMKVMGQEEPSGHLWLEIRRTDGSLGLFDNMHLSPAKSGEWQKYAATGRIDADGKELTFGAMLRGAGQLWLDDLVVSVKEEDGWTVIFDSKGFEMGEAGQDLSGWTLSNSLYQFLTSEGQVYQGHKAITIQSNEPEPISEPLFDTAPEVGDYVVKEIGNGLSCLIPLAVYGDEEKSLPLSEEERLKTLFQEIEKVKRTPYQTSNLFVRLAALFKSWNIFQHFYPYFEEVGVNWELVLTQSILSTFESKTEEEFRQVLEKMTAQLKDGHILVNTMQQRTPMGRLPLDWEVIQGKLVVTRVLSEGIDLAPGDIVTSIDGKPTSFILKQASERISAATEGWLNYRLSKELLIGELDTEVKLELKGKKELSLFYTFSYPEHQKQIQDSLSFRELEEGIYYLNLSRMSMEAIREQFPLLQTARGVVCDLRGYPNRNHELIQHLLSEPDTSTKWMLIPQTIYPDQEQLAGYQEFGWEMEPLKPQLTAPIVFITDGSAISYAESFMSFIEHYDLATIVGQPTAGTNGNVNVMQLPGGYSIGFTGMKVVKQDGSRLHGVGILPDVAVERTIKGVRKGKDELLEAALKELK
jgi:C-terminal processing protease CtpA/Prc